MEDIDFVNRIMYICTCMERVLGVNTYLPQWMFIKHGDESPFDIPSMPSKMFPGEIGIPHSASGHFTTSLAFYSRRCIQSFVKLVEYRLGHPYNVLAKFDEGIYYQISDILSDILYKWFMVKHNTENRSFYDMFNDSVKQKLFRNSAIKFLEFYNTIMKTDDSKEFMAVCEQCMDEKLREFWFGYSFNFSQGLTGTSKFRLLFVTDKGDEIFTDPVLYMDYQVFEDIDSFERTVRGLFKGIFQPTNYPSSRKSIGLDIFR